MYIVSANTYLESYGSLIHLFHIGKSQAECIDFMKDYNQKAKEAETFIKVVLENGHKRPWELSDKDKEVWEMYKEMFAIDDYSTEVFKFDEDNLGDYIDKFNNGNPLYLGGYWE